MSTYYVYILFCKKHVKSYVGLTENVQKRLNEHNSKQSGYTSKYGPWEVIQVEEFETRIEARKREKYLKSAVGRRWMRRNINWPRSSACLDLRRARRAE